MLEIWRIRAECGHNGDFIWEIREVASANAVFIPEVLDCRDGTYILAECFHVFSSIMSDDFLYMPAPDRELIIIPSKDT